MSRLRLKRVSRPVRIGALLGLGLPLIVAPFLAYAGFAVANVSAKWADSVLGNSVGLVVGVGAFMIWSLLVLGVPALCGGLLGGAVHRMRIR